MNKHADELLAESMEGELSPHDSSLLSGHLATCTRCASLQHALRENDDLIGRAEPISIPLPVRRPVQGTAVGSRIVSFLGVGLAAVTLALVVGLGISGARVALRDNAAASDSARATTSPNPTFTFPGALLVVDQGAHVLVVADGQGRELASYVTGGLPTSRPVISPTRDAVAFWREAQGTQELVIINLRTRTTKIVASSGNLISYGTIWTADGTALVYALASPPSERPAGSVTARAELTTVDVGTGERRQIANFSEAFPLVPVFADGRNIAGTRSAGGLGVRYEVVDRASGRVTTSSASAGFSETQVDPRNGAVIGVVRTLESTRPTQVRVWIGADYDHPLAMFELVGLEGVLRDPSGERIVFGSASGEILRFDYRKNTSESVVKLNGPVVPLAISEDGLTLVVERPSAGVRYQILTLHGNTYTLTDFALTSQALTPGAQVLGAVTTP